MKPRILVIRGGAIGDFVLTLPAIKLLRDNFPQVHLEILGYKHIIELAEGRYYADATRSIEYGALSRFFIPGADLPEDLVEYFASFQQVVSYLYDPDRFFEQNLRRSGVRHFLHGNPKMDDDAHAVRQLARPLESLALYLEDEKPALFPTEADRTAASALLERLFPQAGPLPGPLIALHPGSGGERKNWPVERWAALGEMLFSNNARVALIGGEADASPLRRLSEAWKGKTVRRVENLPLPVLAGLLAQADLFLGHDSGISHIAAAAGARCLLLFGPTDPDVWAPPSPAVTILRAPGGEMDRLETEAVAERLRAVFQG